MNILSLETSGREASLATLCGEITGARLIRETCISGQRRTAQKLAPAMRDLIAASHWQPQDIGLVTVSMGPGSFTGLRIGITAAKVFAYAVGADVLGIATLRAVAYQTAKNIHELLESTPACMESLQTGPMGPSPHPKSNLPTHICAAMHGERGQVFVAYYTFNSTGEVEPVDGVKLLEANAWIHALMPAVVVTGPALVDWASALPDHIPVADQALWQPAAKTIGELGWSDYQRGCRHDPWTLVPQYHRLSAAEEKQLKEKKRE